MASFAKEREASVPDALGIAWKSAVENWEQPARHDEVIRLVSQHDAYAWAAAQYRSRAGDPIADRQLERVKKAAEVTLLSSSARKDAELNTPYRNTIFLLITILVLMFGGLMYAWVKSSRTAPSPPTLEGGGN